MLLFTIFATAWQVTIADEITTRLHDEQQWLLESMGAFTAPAIEENTEVIEDEISTGKAAPVRQESAAPILQNPWEVENNNNDYRPARKRSR